MMTAQLEIRGTCASPGFAHGPLHVLAADIGPRERTYAGPEHDDVALRSALDAAIRELTGLLAHAADGDESDLLEFQIAMLEDPTIVQAPFDAIATGTPAETAWSAALDLHVADYRAAADSYFMARAADLEDMRDRVLRCLSGAPVNAIPVGAIVVAAELAPSRFLEISWQGGGIALFGGSSSSHVATLARARGVPMIIGMTPASALPAGDGLLDADDGVLIAAPEVAAVRAFVARRSESDAVLRAERQFLPRAATTADGQRVHVLLNVAHLDDLAGVDPEHCDGIGLVRTELLFRNLADLHDEERQLAQYRALIDWAHGRPVTFRTLDAGGDKPIAGYTLPSEANPFLGVRGVRLSLAHPEILLVQLRALARAAAYGELRVMIPMVTLPDELDRVRALLGEAVTGLRASGTACGEPRLGMMVEVPAAALTIDTFGADFFSIGSNDLIAYTTATSRDSDRLTALADPLQPAVLRLIRAIVTSAQAAGRDVSLCGDMAGDARMLPALLGAGLRSLSVAPAILAKVKATIAAFSGAAVG